MARRNTTIYLLAAGLGAIAGMRSMAAPALLSHQLAQRPRWWPRTTIEQMLSTETASRVLKVLAVGEMAVDKMPGIPDRIDLPFLAGRALSGALTGAALASYERRRTMPVALVSALSAVGATYAMFYTRRFGSHRFLREPFLGFLEDGIAVGAGLRLLRRV